jgi:hypothetical protein
VGDIVKKVDEELRQRDSEQREWLLKIEEKEKELEFYTQETRKHANKLMTLFSAMNFRDHQLSSSRASLDRLKGNFAEPIRLKAQQIQYILDNSKRSKHM